MQSKIVAIVDDDPNMLNAPGRLLAAYGFEAAAYDSVEAFWECHDSRNATCVVLDINLPGMSGIELRHRLKKMDSSLPVMLTVSRTINADCLIGFMADRVVTLVEAAQSIGIIRSGLRVRMQKPTLEFLAATRSARGHYRP
jgi:DNA-binding response OmpR family regulator